MAVLITPSMGFSALGIALISVVIAMPILPAAEAQGSTFIETRLCTSGRTLRIEIPGQNEPEQEAPMPCHAVCSRDDDSADPDKSEDDDASAKKSR